MADKMIFKVTILWLHTTTYSRRDKHESRHIIKKESSRYERRQQGCRIAQGQVIDKKSNHRSRCGYNQKKPNKRTESLKGIGKGWRLGMGRQWNSLYG